MADAWDAMISDRPESGPLPVEAAIKELEINSGTQFDPDVARLYISIIKGENKDSLEVKR